MSDPTVIVRRTHPSAIAGFVLGLASLLLLGLTGLPALWFGLSGLRAVNASEGRLRGARLAIAGMVLGGIGTTVTLLGVCALIMIELRLTSNRVESANHLRQIGLALNKYADAHGSFPPATRNPRDLAPDARLSWMADILPLLDEGTARNQVYQELAKKIDRTKGWEDPANAPVLATSLRLFLCRGHPDYEPNRSPGLTHYVAVAGINPRAAYLRREDPRAGMFGHDRGVKRREATRGISSTMMVLETACENGPWLAGGFPTVRGLDPDVNDYIGPGRPFGGVQSGMMNILYVDGSVRQEANNTSAEVFRGRSLLHWDEVEP